MNINMLKFGSSLLCATDSGGGSILPHEYQQVEYIQSDGNQFIYDSTSIMQAPEDVYIKINLYQALQTDYCHLISTDWLGTNAKTVTIFIGINANTSVYGLTLMDLFPNFPLNQDMEVSTRISYKSILLNGDYYKSLGGNASYYQATGLYLLGKKTDGTNLQCKLYYFKCENSTKDGFIMNMFPCYRKSDHKPGLYDIERNLFLTNANTSATTDFICGPNV